jgi:hypothetical protein
LALLARKSADLTLVVEQWDKLPHSVRAGIVAMVKAAGGDVAVRSRIDPYLVKW